VSDYDTLDNLAAKKVAEVEAQCESDRAARTAREAQERDAEHAAWHGAVAPTVVACGVRQSLVSSIVEQARSAFELKDGKLVAKSGITNRRDPCADYTVVDWLADLHASDDALLWEKQK
jgi:hypothetical protein